MNSESRLALDSALASNHFFSIFSLPLASTRKPRRNVDHHSPRSLDRGASFLILFLDPEIEIKRKEARL